METSEDEFLTWATLHLWLLDKFKLPAETVFYIFKCGYFSAQKSELTTPPNNKNSGRPRS